jgi:hypothetical protein
MEDVRHLIRVLPVRTEQDRPIAKGDQFPWIEGKTRIVLDVLPYTGHYPHWFNCVLVLSSPHTVSGRIEKAHHDPALPLAAGPKW